MKSLCAGLHVMMQCYKRKHFADRCWLHEHLGGPRSRREPMMRAFTEQSDVYFVGGLARRCNIQKMQFRSNEYLRKTTGFFTNSWRIKIALESYFDEHGKEVWERNWMNLEVQTTLLKTYPPKMIATILKALRERLKEDDQLNAVEEIAGPVPESEQILRDGGGFLDDVNGGDICLEISCWLPEVKKLLHGYLLKVSTNLSRCKIVKMQTRSCWS